MSNVDRLTEALVTEFEEEGAEVVFAPAIPNTFVAPSVVVAPGDPFLTPSTMAPGAVVETWEVLVCVNFGDKAAALTQMRDLSLRVRKAVSGVGAVWRQASGPRRRDGETNKNLILSLNTVTFTHTQGAP